MEAFLTVMLTRPRVGVCFSQGREGRGGAYTPRLCPCRRAPGAWVGQKVTPQPKGDSLSLLKLT